MKRKPLPIQLNEQERKQLEELQRILELNTLGQTVRKLISINYNALIARDITITRAIIETRKHSYMSDEDLKKVIKVKLKN